jgi:hypothetical protein
MFNKYTHLIYAHIGALCHALPCLLFRLLPSSMHVACIFAVGAIVYANVLHCVCKYIALPTLRDHLHKAGQIDVACDDTPGDLQTPSLTPRLARRCLSPATCLGKGDYVTWASPPDGIASRVRAAAPNSVHHVQQAAALGRFFLLQRDEGIADSGSVLLLLRANSVFPVWRAIRRAIERRECPGAAAC